MLNDFKDRFGNLVGNSVQATEDNTYVCENGCASIVILFSGGTKLRAEYWRLIKSGRAFVSSFDHNQIYGLPKPIDAVELLSQDLQGQIVTEAIFESETGDILLCFTNSIRIQIFNFTGYEIWEIEFPDGIREYSNYEK